MFALNTMFFLSGVCLNSLVILSFWRNEQLRKKLCYFTIMILSCFDLVSVLANHSLTAFFAMYWLKTEIIFVGDWVRIFSLFANILLGLPFVALLVMNFDRYLATHHPLFHRTSVTKGKLLIPLAVLSIGFAIVMTTSENNVVINIVDFLLICIIIFLLPMLFFNYKLFTIARKSRRNKKESSEVKTTFSLKKISSCLLSTTCFMVFSIPVFVSISLFKRSAFDNVFVASFWIRTIAAMNGTFNCLIFFWKNKVLRDEGMKVFRGLKVCRRDQS